MTIRFYLSKSSEGTSIIFCYLMEKNHTFSFSTKERINPDNWDKKIQRAIIRNRDDNQLVELNKFIDAMEDQLKSFIRKTRIKNTSATFYQIVAEIKKKFSDNAFYEIYEKFIDSKRKTGKDETVYKFNRLKKLLQEFEIINKEKLNLDSIQPVTFENFYYFLISEKKMLNNTANKQISFLKSFLIWCNRNDYCNNESYKSYQLRWYENDVIFLTKDEVLKLFKMELEETRLKRVRDVFIFMCMTGVRHSDILRIKREDIKNDIWELRTKKTRDPLKIPLNDIAFSILQKYQENHKPLPVISNQKMNIYLKELCKLAGIDDLVKTYQYKGSQEIIKTFKKYEKIGCHTARRTFVSLNLQAGLVPEEIMKITGHKDYKMFKKYIGMNEEIIREKIKTAAWGKLNLN